MRGRGVGFSGEGCERRKGGERGRRGGEGEGREGRRGVVIHRAHRVWGHQDFTVDDGIGNLTSSRTMGLGNYVLTDDVLTEDGVNRLTREFTSSRTMGLGNLRLTDGVLTDDGDNVWGSGYLQTCRRGRRYGGGQGGEGRGGEEENRERERR